MVALTVVMLKLWEYEELHPWGSATEGAMRWGTPWARIEAAKPRTAMEENILIVVELMGMLRVDDIIKWISCNEAREY